MPLQWSGKSIIISTRRFGEHGAIVKLLSAEQGLYVGVCKHALSKRTRGIFEPGNIIEAHWSARLEEHMGTLRGELVRPIAALVMQDAVTLAALRSACALLDATLPERETAPEIYHALENLFLHLSTDHHWQHAYVCFERDLLTHLGYGLDLTQCAATGQTDALSYVSPKSGRAVSREAGIPYHDRLFPLPAYLQQNQAFQGLEPQALLDGLRLTGYFLASWVFAARDKPMPGARDMLESLLERQAMPIKELETLAG